VWAKIQHARLAPDEEGDAALDEPERVDQRGPPWPFFVMLLLANGWFRRPQAFGLARGGPNDVSGRVGSALARLVGFVAVWVIAFATLPLLPVGLALLAWMAWVSPGVRQVHREFQSIPEAEGA
jgi:type IV secretory pathway TrbD component